MDEADEDEEDEWLRRDTDEGIGGSANHEIKMVKEFKVGKLLEKRNLNTYELKL